MSYKGKVILEKYPASEVIKITGRLDYSITQQIDTVARNVSKSKKITIDLIECDFIDSSGLGSLLLIRDKIKARSGIKIRVSNDSMRQKFEITKFDQLFEIIH